MAIKYIFAKGNEYCHATTPNRRDVLIKEGWKHIITLDGWNVSISYK